MTFEEAIIQAEKNEQARIDRIAEQLEGMAAQWKAKKAVATQSNPNKES